MASCGIRRLLAAIWAGFSLVALGVGAERADAAQPAGGAESGLYIDIKESEAPGAPVVSRQRLYRTSHALVIGIDDYVGGWPKLNNAVRDARELADELERHGFQVTLKTDPDARELRETLRAFYALRGAEPDARLLLWFAGHGHTINGEGFLVPADAPPPLDPAFKLKALHMRDFGGLIRLADAKHVLSVFDSCFSGTIFTARAGAAIANITHKTAKPVRQFITSGDAGQQVRDDGSFRKLFIRAIRGDERADANADGFVTGEELGLYLSQRVTNLTDAAQTPRYGRLQDVDYDQGDFVFRLATPAPRQTVQPVQPDQAGVTPQAGQTGTTVLRSNTDHELAFWNAIKDSSDPADYRAYLQSFPQGSFAPLAQLRLARLETAETSAPSSAEPAVTPAEPSESSEQVVPAKRAAPAEQQVAALPPPDADRPAFAVTERDEAFVTIKRSNIRAGPTTDSERIARLDRGESVAVTGAVDGKPWLRVALADGRVGYVYAPLVEAEDAYRARQAAAEEAALAKRKAAAAEEERRKAAAEQQVAGSAGEQQALIRTPSKAATTSPDRDPPIHVCDHLAADPADARRKAKTVATSNVKSARAIEACRSAVDRYPEATRFVFQYARALDKAGRYAEAVREYRRAADRGYPSAHANLGWLHYSGGGVTKDVAAAARWFRKAAERGHAGAQANLGWMYQNGEGVAKNADLAERWYLKAAEQGFVNAQFNLAGMYSSPKSVKRNAGKAVRWYRKAAESGLAEAQYALGEIYRLGEGVPQDGAEAMKWYRRAADQEYMYAQHAMGGMYRTGTGVRKDDAQAAKWYRKAADQGSPHSQNNLGWMYHQGVGVRKDLAAAARWYRKAAEQGDAQAQFNLGWMYHTGDGVRRDIAEAVKWYRKAAAQGDQAARDNLKQLGAY